MPFQQLLLLCDRLILNAKIANDMPGKGFRNFAVTRHRLFTAVQRIAINIVPAAMPLQKTSFCRQQPNKINPFHRAISFVP